MIRRPGFNPEFSNYQVLYAEVSTVDWFEWGSNGIKLDFFIENT